MSEEQLQGHARTILSMLRALGPRPRARLLLVLRALGLSDDEAVEVLAHGMARRLFEADPADPSIMRQPAAD
ncbi:MAG: hypothetical protein QM820_36605 [Minicystis sp.]